MSKYWFYGIMPKDAINKKFLSDKQKKVVNEEAKKINSENYDKSWIGYCAPPNWEFMRHGHEVIIIEEEKGNVARQKLLELLREKYLCSN